MTELIVPELVNNYLTFTNQRSQALADNKLDLSHCVFIYPTTLLPLGVFIKTHPKILYNPPHNQNVANYIFLVTGKISIDQLENKSYVPCVPLPQTRTEAEKVLEYVFRLHHQGKDYGGESVFKYLVSELVDNIYQHSKFSNAYVMAQRYEQKKFVEISFFDDGISIPGSFRKQETKADDSTLIIEAINGRSTKDKERGYGLSSNIRIFTEGLGGQILIVSGGGLVYLEKSSQKVYKLQEERRLSGTLISIRIPIPAKEIKLYDFLN